MKNKALLAYAFLAVPLAFIGLPIYIYLPDFYNQNFNISLQEIALILLVTRLFDALQDPAIGLLSDKFFRIRNKIIAFSCPLLGLSIYFLFSPLGFLDSKTSLIISLFLTYLFFSIIWINHQALAVSLTRDRSLKTTIIAYRESFFILGIILASLLPAILENYFSAKKSFEIIGIFYFFFICACAAFFFKFVKFDSQNTATSPLKLSKIFEPKLRHFFAIFLFNSIASSIPASLITFYVAQVLNLKSKTGLFLILYFLGLILGIIFWTKLSQKLKNKSKTWLISSAITVLVFPFCFFLREGDLAPYALICLLSGFGFAGDFCLSYSILGDIICDQKLEGKESTIFSLTNFLVKISFTISSVALLYLLGTIRESGASETGFLSYSYAVLPCFFKVISVVLLFNFFKKYEKI
ncbi:MAG: MFS transporter [Rickettsiales bacterium]|nr:MFS transporter [Rickettsiales bacterium]